MYSIEQEYITHLYILYGESPNPPPEYTKIGIDLNKGAGGDYIYLCYKTGVRNPITGLTVNAGSSSSFPIPPGYTRIHDDLNKGAGGDYIYVDYTKNVDLPPIKDVYVIYGEKANIYPPYGFVKINTDCNKSVGGHYIYICYYQPV